MTRVLRLETLKRLGGAQKIVRTHLDEAMSDLKPDEQDAAATIFRQLVTPSGTKIAHTVPDLADYARLTQDELTPVLERLSGGDVRILRPVAPPPGQLDGGRYEIFHDVLAPAILDWRARYTEAKAREEAEREAAEAREQAQRERRRARIFRAVAIVAIACAVLAAILGLFNYRQKQTARSRSLANEAVADLAVDPAKSVDEALSALDVKHTQAAKDALFRVVPEARVRRIVDIGGGTVNGVATSPNGKYIATADDDFTAKVWKPDGTPAMNPFVAHTGPVNAVAFSPNSRFLATGSDDASARIWDLQTQDSVQLSHPTKVTDLAYAGNRHLLTVSGGRVYEWDTKTGRDLWAKRAPNGKPVEHVAADPAGDVFATGDAGGGVQIWDGYSGAPLGPPSTTHQVSLNSLAFSVDGGMVASSSIDGTVAVWPYEKTTVPYILTSPGGVPEDARFSPDGHFVAVGYADDTVRVFDVRAQKPLLELRGHGGGVNSVAFTSDGRSLVSVSDDTTARIWDVSLGQVAHFPDVVDSTAFPDKGSNFAAAGWGYVHVGAVGSAKAVGDLKIKPGGHVPTIAFLPGSDGRRIALAFGDAVREWTVGQKASTLLVETPGATVNSFAYSRDGKRLVTGGSDGLTRVWDVATKKADPVLTGHQGAVNAVAFSPDGKVVATGGVDETVRIWDSHGHSKPRVVQASGEVSQLAFSDQGDLLAAASGGLETKVWKYKTHDPPLRLHTGSVDGLAFSPDGKYLATVGPDTLTHVWDTANGHQVAVLRQHADEVTAVSFSPKGRRILSGSADLTAKVYECVTCAPLDDVVKRAEKLVSSLHPKS